MSDVWLNLGPIAGCSVAAGFALVFVPRWESSPWVAAICGYLIAVAQFLAMFALIGRG